MTEGPTARPFVSLVEPQRSTVRYPGGFVARYRWVGSGQADAIFRTTEQSGPLTDHGLLVSQEPDRLCRAEVRVEGPLGAWTARFASLIHDEPQGVVWDVPGLLLIKYGFHAYALEARTGDLRWSHASGTPIAAVLASSRLPHVITQSEVETVALREDGEVAWRIAHSEVIAEAELVGGRLILTGYGGVLPPIDPLSGRTAS